MRSIKIRDINTVPSWVKLLIGELIVVIIIGLIITIFNLNKKIDKDNPLNNEITVNNNPECTIVFNGEQKYNHITTMRFSFIDDSGNKTNLNKSKIDLNNIANTINSELINVNYRVCTMQIIDSELFIQYDDRNEVQDPQNLSIVTLKDNIDIDNYIEIIETINDNNNINAYMILHYNNEYGNVHYMYINELNNIGIESDKILIDNGVNE